MKALNNLSLRGKLLGGFAIVVAIALLQSIVAMVLLSSVNGQSHRISTDLLPSVRTLGDIETTLGEYRASRLRLLIAETPEETASATALLATKAESMAKHIKQHLTLASDSEQKALFADFEAAWKRYTDLDPDFLRLHKAHDMAQMKALFAGAGAANYKVAYEKLNTLIELNAKASESAAAEAEHLYSESRITMIAGLALMAAIAFGIAWMLARRISGDARQALTCVTRVAEGDLGQTIVASSRDEMGQLLEALSRMQLKLRGIVGSVRSNADGVATASQQIAHGNADLSSRTETQASALEQTAASMEQLSSTVKQNADNAQQANQLAQSASDIARQGGEVVGHVVSTMKDINDGSKKIADIIGTIDSIAFQTNILALNAAVEAARAGEQGRGFAVVAGEVRTLAQRSAEAAREIRGLIGSSVERVEQGTQLVDKAGATMQQIVDAIRRVTDIVGEIASASAEQRSGIAQVSDAVAQMDQATQQNAALVEQSAAAAESLKHQAAQMVGSVSVFKLAA